MSFECKICGKRWDEKGYSRDGTFFTLCEECSEEVIKEWRMGLTKVDLQEVKAKK
jgi:ribosome-binding protein aMBF1 (putative translation factor)